MMMKLVLDKLNPSPTTLDRSAFSKVLHVVGARFPAKSLGTIRTVLSKDMLCLPRIKPILNDPLDDPDVRFVLLSVDKYSTPDQIPSTLLDTLKENHLLSILVHKLELGYDYWNMDDILHAALPDSVTIPSGFEIVGHIAHLNLSDDQQPHSRLIGQVILDKNKALRSVVAKVGVIDSVFRFFSMDLLAGAPEYDVEVRQGDCRFRFDYSQVYWNSRLQFEHDRIIEKIVRRDCKNVVIIDVFAGVGPFVIPAAKKGATVYANDLNPAAHSACIANCALNKVKTVKCFNMDGREFISKSADFIGISDQGKQVHYLMNLPALAPEFCDAFNALATGGSNLRKISVHCYMFCRPGELPVDKVKEHLKLPFEVLEEHLVRSVAPNKDMFCLSFEMNINHGSNKKQRIDV